MLLSLLLLVAQLAQARHLFTNNNYTRSGRNVINAAGFASFEVGSTLVAGSFAAMLSQNG